MLPLSRARRGLLWARSLPEQARCYVQARGGECRIQTLPIFYWADMKLGSFPEFVPILSKGKYETMI